MTLSLTDITPAEAAVCFGDRLVESRPTPRFDLEAVPTTGRGVRGTDLVEAAVVCLVAALISRGAVATVTSRKHFLIFTTTRVELRLTTADNPWPERSPEAVVFDWFAAEPGRTGLLEEALLMSFLPRRATHVWRLGYEALHARLVARRYLDRSTIRVLLLLTKVQFAVAERHRADFQAMAHDAERALASLRDRLSPELRAAIASDWRGAVNAMDIPTAE